MYRWISHTTTILFILIYLPIYGKSPPPNRAIQVYSDTVITRINYRERVEKADALYDTLQNKKGKFSQLLYRSFVRSRDQSDEGLPMVDFKVNRGYFEYFKGRVITDIRVVQANVFSPRESSEKVSKVQQFIDKLHLRTKAEQLEQNFMFEVGDTINPYAMGINEEYLRSLPYLSTAYFVITNDPNNKNGVVVNVFARDNWSISADVMLSDDENYLSVFDRNFLGSADELRITARCEEPVINPSVEVEYQVRNLLGSFVDLDIRLGAGAVANIGAFKAERRFLLPSDHGFGVNVSSSKQLEYLPIMDTAYYIGRFQVEAWYGKSWCLEWRKGTSIYLTGGYTDQSFYSTPQVTAHTNPLYQNNETALIGFGYARKNYFQGNMVYGYGRTEDIPYGFRAEIIGGVQWNEWLGRRPYFGARGYWGDLTKIGYLEVGLEAGSFFTDNWTAQQGSFIGRVRYFSPLIPLKSSYIRQFVNIHSSIGLNRLAGEREALRYERWSGIRGLRHYNDDLMGYNRLTISGETVFFTPIFLYHFRFAFFAFGDIGWLGDHYNPFKNRFTGACGIGVRVKNERLIFNNIQIRLGYAFNRPDGIGYSYFSVSNEQTFIEPNFSAGKPEIIGYK